MERVVERQRASREYFEGGACGRRIVFLRPEGFFSPPHDSKDCGERGEGEGAIPPLGWLPGFTSMVDTRSKRYATGFRMARTGCNSFNPGSRGISSKPGFSEHNHQRPSRRVSRLIRKAW